MGQIAYPSANPFEIHHILRKLDHAKPQEMFGWLVTPEVPAGKETPCVVCCHGSLGWRGHHHEYMVRWLEAGMAVFRVHSFDARNVKSIVEDQLAVTHAMLLADAYQALRMLGSHPAIDSTRIGISGWSLGGSVALYAAWEPVAEALSASPRTSPSTPPRTCGPRFPAGRAPRSASCTEPTTTTRRSPSSRNSPRNCAPTTYPSN